MPSSPDDKLESWIASRKQSPPADLLNGVMETLQNQSKLVAPEVPKLSLPPWLMASGCLLAGIGKISLILHLAF